MVQSGTHFLWVSIDGESQIMELTVPGASEVVFEPMAVTGLRVDREALPLGLHDSDLANGDLVVAIAGTEFQNWQQVQVLSQSARMEPTVSLTVHRAGATIDLEIQTAHFRVDSAGFRPVRR